MAAEDDTDRLGVTCGDFGDVEAELETGPAPRDPDGSLTETGLCKGFAVSSGGKSNTSVRVKVVDVVGFNKTVHGGVDRRCRTTLTVQAEVEGGDHFVFVLFTGVNTDEFTQTVHAEHGQPLFGKRAEVAT